MSELLTVVLPVFIIVAFGYAAAWRGLFSETAVDMLMKFAQGFAIPCLLFNAISTLELSTGFRMDLLGSFYIGASCGFAVGTFGARFLFRRSWEDSVAIGFCGLFSNSVMLGLPITERAYGADALTSNFAIVSFHAPFCYAVGITAMEFVRARGGPLRELPGKVLRAMFSNALIIAIALGFAVNVTGTPVPGVLREALTMMAVGGIPAALFGLGGVLFRYRPEGDLRVIAFITSVSLFLHPAITYGLAQVFDLSRGPLRSAVITSAMAPGINAYLFASMYGSAKRVAASSVLLGTALTVLTATFWLTVLP
ncbi:AEC family transporter [Ponticoccus sp. SC2-23]|uniref:AEC family transporter n=1 Tax=Alexandriicola marinus TaxID=2081710 RepID=UPI000FD768A6|nr:AEC family transporter [Alexandriicola marinus]MBM1220967.1 AEC family transporter [Ponticoccus sp. SC6-9]MBM1225537.1 AEC family transporter [Ponticoccus sp. SC6-15]MBM1227720.1 AEC family transporter [Ponticoccus sp. SC6-38]MBM1234642.1 AEC family transporter [Ponticoccus sp. SC6-45]MBM1238222.1 AEC family transporter [Ponticoccus sp. SC6-49]MBM1244145.1 AEC family transporter [Ponticoccus sp. SC2-64]MBM1248166.1 AEC family transporter [Ponticoccus sp. SC6-42]MBM1252622.1 AEC family tr